MKNIDDNKHKQFSNQLHALTHAIRTVDSMIHESGDAPTSRQFAEMVIDVLDINGWTIKQKD